MVRHKKHRHGARGGRAIGTHQWVAKVPPTPQPKCEETGKTIFHSESSAKKSLVGQLSTKHVRIYRCDIHPSHFHLTKTYK